MVGITEFQRMHDGPELFRVTSCGSQVLKKDLFGRSDLGNNLIADGFIFVIPIKAFGGFETLVKTFTESDVMLNVTINPGNGTIKVSWSSGNTPFHDRQKRSRPTIPKNVNVLGFSGRWEAL